MGCKLILVTVPDEEVNSSGMRKAIHIIAEYQQQYDLDIQLHLNSEPTFQQLDNDLTHYVYSGSIGKSCQACCVWERNTCR